MVTPHTRELISSTGTSSFVVWSGGRRERRMAQCCGWPSPIPRSSGHHGRCLAKSYPPGSEAFLSVTGAGMAEGRRGRRGGGRMDRAQAIAQRIHAQQLDRPRGARAVTDAAVLDLGVQDTGRDGASWALVNRGVPLASAEQLEGDEALALAWTLRSAPHYYRRSDLPDVLVAPSPFSDRDAAKRVLGADKPLEEAGIPVRAGLAELAGRLHDLVRQPMVKGEVSSRLTAALPDPYLKDCVPCGSRHVWEVPFRIGALDGGLELTPGTSPPVLRPVPDWPRQDWGPAADPLAAPERLQVIRAYLRLLGPASKKDVAAFLDAPLAEVKERWPPEAGAGAVGRPRGRGVPARAG